MAAVTRPRDERGLTLTEVTVVMVLGTMIMAGLVAFYLSSQGLWIEASTQAITQREASLLTAAMRDSIRQSGSAVATPSPDALHQQLSLFRPGASTPYYYFWWEPTDSLIHAGPKEQLDLTTNTQPVMLTAGIACWRAFVAETGATPVAAATTNAALRTSEIPRFARMFATVARLSRSV